MFNVHDAIIGLSYLGSDLWWRFTWSVLHSYIMKKWINDSIQTTILDSLSWTDIVGFKSELQWWWFLRVHFMTTPCHGNIFCNYGPLYEELTEHYEFPQQRTSRRQAITWPKGGHGHQCHMPWLRYIELNVCIKLLQASGITSFYKLCIFILFNFVCWNLPSTLR